MAILSIQSSVAYGHVGNAAAVFALQRLGHEVWPVNTVLFSNHPGYGDFAGRRLEARELTDLIRGMARRGVFTGCGAVLSGYLGGGTNGAVVLEAVKAAKEADPASLFACDPVMGDVAEGLYVAADVVAFFRDQALKRADIGFPNLFELGVLTGQPVHDQATALGAARALQRSGPALLLVTSVPMGDAIGVLAVERRVVWRIATPRLALRAKGAGDVLAALFLGHFLRGRNVRRALERAVSGLYAVIEATAGADAPELALVAAQAAMVAPKRRFAAERAD